MTVETIASQHAIVYLRTLVLPNLWRELCVYRRLAICEWNTVGVCVTEIIAPPDAALMQ